MSVELFRGHREYFEDEEWKTSLPVGVVLLLSGMLVPFAGQLIHLGWIAEVSTWKDGGRVGPRPSLRWDLDQWFSTYLVRGAFIFISQFVWALPMALVAMVFACVVFSGAFAAGLLSTTMPPDGPPLLLVVPIACGVPLLWLATAVFVGLGWVASYRVVRSSDLAQGFEVVAVLRSARAVWVELLFGFVVYTALMSLVAPLGMLACCVGLFAVTHVHTYATYDWLGQLHDLAVERGEPPAPLMSGTTRERTTAPGSGPPDPVTGRDSNDFRNG